MLGQIRVAQEGKGQLRAKGEYQIKARARAATADNIGKYPIG